VEHNQHALLKLQKHIVDNGDGTDVYLPNQVFEAEKTGLQNDASLSLALDLASQYTCSQGHEDALVVLERLETEHPVTMILPLLACPYLDTWDAQV
jgi:hypothetical protein